MTYIDSRHKLFAHLDRLAAWQRGEKPSPVTVEWDLSNRCVLGCRDCHFAHTHVRGPWVVKPRMLPMAYDSGGDLADIRIVRRGLDEMARAGVLGIVWSGGGEPTTHPEWTRAVAHAANAGLHQGMYTLGGLLTEDTAKFLSRTVEWVVVSLDTCNEDDYALEKEVPKERFFNACDGIGWLAGSNATIGVSFLLHGDNWEQAPRMLTLARSLGASYTTFRPSILTSPDNPAKTTDDRDWITVALPMLNFLSTYDDVELDVTRFEQYRDWNGRSYGACHGIKLNATITPDSRVWVCPQRRGCTNSCVGDLRTTSWEDIWSGHPGQWEDFTECRVMCRLHLMNETLEQVFEPRQHEAFL